MMYLAGCLIIPFFTALLCLLSSRNVKRAHATSMLSSLLLLGCAGGLLKKVLDVGYVSMQPGQWPAPMGITLIADVFSALMVLITAIISVAVMLYARHDISSVLARKHFYALTQFLLLGVNGAFITGDLFNLYVWFEVMLLASFVLITFEGTGGQLEGGVKYLVINLFSSFLFLSGVGLIYGNTGTLNMADIAQHLSHSSDALLINSSAMLLIAAFGIKSALFPFFFWLPASYHTPRIVISALFAGLLTKVGIYAFIRCGTLVFSSQFDVIQGVLLFLAGATMVTGVLGAAAQYDIRKILSFHIVSQIGYIMMGFAIGTKAALAGAVFYTLHHIVVKSNLFLICGIIEQRCGHARLKELGGLYCSTPWLALLFFIPAFSLGGMPPLSGFWAKFAIIQAALLEGHYALVATGLLVGVLTLYSMTKIWAEAFWKKPPNPLPIPEKTPSSLWLPCSVLAGITLIIGLWSGPLFDLSLQAAEQLVHPEAYIEFVLHSGDTP